MQTTLSWFQAQPLSRQWRLAAVSTVVLCAVAAALLLLIHRTTPAPAPGLTRADPARLGAAVDLALKATRGDTAGRRDAPPAALPEPAMPGSAVRESSASGADSQAAAVAVTERRTQRLAATVPAVPVARAARAPRLAGAPMGRGAVTTAHASPPVATRLAGQDRQPTRTMRLAALRPALAESAAANPAATASGARALPAAGEMSRGLPEFVAVSTSAGARPAARGLFPTMVSECADTAFLNRFLCEQRVRLGYCRDRWNQHADCMVDPPRDP